MKRVLKSILIGLSILLLLTGCQKEEVKHIDITSYDVDMSGYNGMKSTDHHFKGVAPEEMLRIIKEGGSAVFYIGYEECASCQASITYLEEAAKNTESTIYYVNPYSKDHDFFGQLNEIIDTLKSVLREDPNGSPTIYTPHVFAIVNGEIKASEIGEVEDASAYEKVLNEVK